MMNSYWNYKPLRTKRKMSGPVTAIMLSDTDPSVFPLPIPIIGHPSPRALLCAIDVAEVLSFIGWVVAILGILIAGVTVWILFFEFVVRPDNNEERAKWGGLWSALAVIWCYYRYMIRSRCGSDIRGMIDHAEIFVATSLVMIFAINSAFYIHTQTEEPLKDLGFMIIPEQSVDSSWHAVSDIMTIILPIVCGLQTVFMSRENRCVIFSDFFRLVTICYALRAITTPLTSLPGPAPHCRKGSVSYIPPESWIDIVTRVGPMHGKFNTCGDLLFSGHACYTNSALLLYLRRMDVNFPRYSWFRWIIGSSYLVTMSLLAISGRKHYTVDLVLGIIVSTLVFFHFEFSWKPSIAQSYSYSTIQVAESIQTAKIDEEMEVI